MSIKIKTTKQQNKYLYKSKSPKKFAILFFLHILIDKLLKLFNSYQKQNMKKLWLKTLLFWFFTIMWLWAVALPVQTHAIEVIEQWWFGNNAAGGIAVWGTKEAGNSDNLMKIIKNFINRILGLLGLIALVVLLRGGFQMVTAAGNEEKYKKGFTILKQAAIGLVFIGLSFFIVTMIFSVIWKQSNNDPNGVINWWWSDI